MRLSNDSIYKIIKENKKLKRWIAISGEEVVYNSDSLEELFKCIDCKIFVVVDKERYEC